VHWYRRTSSCIHANPYAFRSAGVNVPSADEIHGESAKEKQCHLISGTYGCQGQRILFPDTFSAGATHPRLYTLNTTMDKDHILSEVLHTARKNAGTALGDTRLVEETGIKESDW
jgi:hypothetical protein